MDLTKSLKNEHNWFIVDDDVDRIVSGQPYSIKKYNENELMKEYKSYVHDMGEYMLYISDRNVLIPEQKNLKLIFKKNKLYFIPKRIETILICSDEFGTEFNMMDIWWEMFYFVNDKNFTKIERKIKLDKLNELQQ